MHVLFSGIAGLMTPTMLLVVFCGVLFWARAPFCCCCGHFCVRRYANLAGGFAFRPSAGCWFLCFCFDVATVVFELYSCGLVKLVQTFADLIRLSCFKDRASELYRPHSESKKRRTSQLPWSGFSSSCMTRHVGMLAL